MSHVTHVYESCHTCASWLIHMCDMTHLYVCDMTRLHVWQTSSTCVDQLMDTCDIIIYMCDMTHWHMWHVSFMRVAWFIYACDMTQLCVWHDSSDVYNAPTLWLVHMCDLMIHQAHHVWHEWLTYVTWLIYMCDVTWLVRSQRTHIPTLFTCVTWRDLTSHVTSHL